MVKAVKNTEKLLNTINDIVPSKENEVLIIKKNTANVDKNKKKMKENIENIENIEKNVEEVKDIKEVKDIEEVKTLKIKKIKDKNTKDKNTKDDKKNIVQKITEEVKIDKTEKKKAEPIIITNTGYDNIDNDSMHDNMSVSTNTRNNMKYIKNEEGLFVCPTCGVTKKNQNTMHYHMKKHMDELPHVCKTCKKSFLQKQTLDLHIASRHPEVAQESENVVQYCCSFNGCGFTSFSKGNCRTHMLRIHFAEEISNIMSKDDNGCITCTNCYNDFKSHGAFYYHCIGCLSLSEEDPRLKYLENIM